MTKNQNITKPEEIEFILNALGRTETKGEYRDKHIGQVLTYCQLWQHGDYPDLRARLSIRIGVSARNIQNNYLDGFEAEGIIKTIKTRDGIRWQWIGHLAFKTEEFSLSEYAKEQEKKKVSE